jgi:hypothetical protein
MSDQVRAWRVLKSFRLGLTVGGLAGIVIIGLTYNKFIGDLEPWESFLAGIAVAAVLTLILTYLFDQVSKSVSSFSRALKGKVRKGGSEDE